MNIKLKKKTSKMNTDRRGEAFFGLTFVSGIPGIYRLAFQAGSVRSQNSNEFQLVNPILNITYINNPPS